MPPADYWDIEGSDDWDEPYVERARHIHGRPRTRPFESRRYRSHRYWDSEPLDSFNDYNDYHYHNGPSGPRRVRPYRFNPPKEASGQPLSVDIRLFGRGHDEPMEISGSWQWPTRPGPSGPQSEPHHMLIISAARRSFDPSKCHRLDITSSEHPQKNTTDKEYPIKWLHVQRRAQDFDEFETIAMNIPELSTNWKFVVSGLLKQVAELVRLSGDKYQGPWMLRADGVKSDWASTQEIPPSATCFSFPYFDLGPVQGHGEKGTQHQYPIMSLYQWTDRTDATRQWHLDQSYPQMAKYSNAQGQIIYVPHLWCLIAGNVILTYGPTAFSGLVEDSIHQIIQKGKTVKGPTSVQVTDMLNCTYELDMQECRTFFELQRTIARRCFENSLQWIRDIDILLQDGSVLTGESWVIAVRAEQSSTIKLSLFPKPLSLSEGHSNRQDRPYGNAVHIPPPSSQHGPTAHSPSRRSRTPSPRGRSRVRRTGDTRGYTVMFHTSDGTDERQPAARSPPQTSPVLRSSSPSRSRSRSASHDHVPHLFSANLRIPSLPEIGRLVHRRGNSERMLREQRPSSDEEGRISEALIVSRVTAALNKDFESDSTGHSGDESTELEDTSRALVLYNNGRAGVVQRPSFEFTGVTQLGYPTSLIISNSGRADHIRRRTLRHRQEQIDRQDLERAVDVMRSTQNRDLVQRKMNTKEREQLPGVIVVKDRRKHLPSVYVPVEKEPEQSSDQETSKRRSLPESDNREREHSSMGMRDQPDSGRKGEIPSKQRQRTSTTPNHPMFNKNLKLRSPPFLSWITHKDPISSHDGDSSLSEHIERILESIHITLKDQGGKANRKVYRISLELLRDQLEKTYPYIKTLNANISTLEEQTSSESTSAGGVEVDPQDTANINVGEVDSTDFIHMELLKKCNAATAEFLRTVQTFLSFYLPLSSTHPVVQKCWGAFETILSMEEKGLKHEKKTKEKAEPAFWVVRDGSSDQETAQNVEPVLSWQDCNWCQSGRIHRKYDDAVHHLKEIHFRASSSKGKEAEVSPHTLTNWLRNDHQYRTDQRLELYISYINLALRHLRKIHTRAKYIREGVLNTQAPHTTRYMLPSSLVNSLECAIMLILLTARSFEYVHRYCDHFEENQESKVMEIEGLARLKHIRSDLEAAGIVAVESMERAERDIMLMTFTDVSTEVVRYDAVGPEYILLTVMTNLFNRGLRDKERIDDVYSSFVQEVYLDAKNHPRTRVIRDIWRLREELDLIKSINTAQWDTLSKFRTILNPSSFRITTQTRVNRFAVEEQFIDYAQWERREDQNHIKALSNRLNNINTHVVQMLEIQQESNGNALIVFTLVTIIFLPLSWATSYLGMNTADIRTMNSGQSLFWAIAVPVTSVVIGLSLAVVLKGEAIREFFIRRRSGIEKRLARRHLPKKTPSRMLTNMSTYKSMEDQSRGWSRFRRKSRNGGISKV